MPRASAVSAPSQSAPKPRPSWSRPSANFTGVLGSARRAASQDHSAVNTRPNSRMKTGLVAWNVEAGISRAADRAVDVAVGEVVDRAAGLLEERPEQHREEHQHERDEQPLALDALAAQRLEEQERERSRRRTARAPRPRSRCAARTARSSGSATPRPPPPARAMRPGAAGGRAPRFGGQPAAPERDRRDRRRPPRARRRRTRSRRADRRCSGGRTATRSSRARRPRISTWVIRTGATNTATPVSMPSVARPKP